MLSQPSLACAKIEQGAERDSDTDTDRDRDTETERQRDRADSAELGLRKERTGRCAKHSGIEATVCGLCDTQNH